MNGETLNREIMANRHYSKISHAPSAQPQPGIVMDQSTRVHRQTPEVLSNPVFCYSSGKLKAFCGLPSKPRLSVRIRRPRIYHARLRKHETAFAKDDPCRHQRSSE
ncbi:hypothetical protein EVAR_42781_1 [Eumeta japonica]|uniref:Uncharacterized protein n=1 Tax=Eumeta variegata TaxID=151549 RepID=A0A4C1WJK4_EUMVA|nr:hypothetical protein EVAR_42781_1 [Eumeta japonica]